MACNVEKIKAGGGWKDFEQKTQPSLIQTIEKMFREELEDNFVSICIQRFIQKNSKTDWPKYRMNKESNMSDLSRKSS